MASHSSVAVSTSPKGGANGEGATAGSSSPKGQCLCSPTTHEGSFRCRFHRAKSSSSSAWMKRSKSMPTNQAARVSCEVYVNTDNQTIVRQNCYPE
ncbi:hypothetical protein P3X46_007764 [Hevea brasiliensis]|uniref:Uncharacterized protein n=1 Tax=Hevea brasiliensis TaxID=3981 RepID=A0ABQ9MWZ2_HEVBR|nr:hypothetical protein P3X46_007764 [Hevea brasiliensis]